MRLAKTSPSMDGRPSNSSVRFDSAWAKALMQRQRIRSFSFSLVLLRYAGILGNVLTASKARRSVAMFRA